MKMLLKFFGILPMQIMLFGQLLMRFSKTCTEAIISIRHDQPDPHQHYYCIQHTPLTSCQLLSHLPNHPFLSLCTRGNLHSRRLMCFQKIPLGSGYWCLVNLHCGYMKPETRSQKPETSNQYPSIVLWCNNS